MSLLGFTPINLLDSPGNMASNNPFALSKENMTAQRYPDMGSLDPQYAYNEQQRQQQQQMMMSQQQQQYGGQQQGMQQMQQPQMYPQQTGYSNDSHQSFQPQSQFGSYLQSQGTGLNFGAPSQMHPSATGYASQMGASSFYNPSPQPHAGTLHSQMVADLDPFSGQQRRSQPQQQQPQQQQSYNTTPQQRETRQEQQYGEHPRAFMKSNKTSLESWDTNAWARVRALFQQLERAWEGRKKLVMEWQTWNLSMDDRQLCERLRKEADENIDMVAAYALQVKEVFESYRHSSDSFSRNQVRTAMNQGLQVLPDWPLTLQAPPKLDNGSQNNSSGRDSLFYSASEQQQQQQPSYQQQQPTYQQQQQQQPQYQQQPQMYPQQTGYGQQQPQQQYGMMQQPQMTGMPMYGQQQQQQPGMYRQW